MGRGRGGARGRAPSGGGGRMGGPKAAGPSGYCVCPSCVLQKELPELRLQTDPRIAQHPASIR